MIVHHDEAQDTWTLDKEATRKAREEIRAERRGRSVSYSEFFDAQHERIITGNLTQPVKTMYTESMELSPSWATEFRQFWKLPENFRF